MALILTVTSFKLAIRPAALKLSCDFFVRTRNSVARTWELEWARVGFARDHLLFSLQTQPRGTTIYSILATIFPEHTLLPVKHHMYWVLWYAAASRTNIGNEPVRPATLRRLALSPLPKIIRRWPSSICLAWYSFLSPESRLGSCSPPPELPHLMWI